MGHSAYVPTTQMTQCSHPSPHRGIDFSLCACSMGFFLLFFSDAPQGTVTFPLLLDFLMSTLSGGRKNSLLLLGLASQWEDWRGSYPSHFFAPF